MCGRVIQSSAPLRYAIVDGMNVRDSRFHNYPPRWNGAPSQELLVIRRNHKTGEVSLDPLRWGLIPYWCKDPAGGRKPINAKCETVRELPTFRDAYRKRRCIVPVTASSSGRPSQAQGKPKAYTVSELESLDPTAQATFTPLAQAAMKAAGGRTLNTGGGKVVGIDGPPPPKRVVINEWDSLDQAEAY